jgi:hypothetical protein
MIGGRLDTHEKAPDALDKADLRQAYERGRRDERAARRRRPLLMTITFALALVGLALLVLAAVNGSFGRAGGIVDEKLNVAAERAGPAVDQAAGAAGQKLRDARGQIRNRSDSAG